MTTFAARRSLLRDDQGSSTATSILQVVVILGVVGVLGYDILSCVINGGLAEGVAEDAGRRAAVQAEGKPLSNQQAFDVATQYLVEEKPGYTVIPESVMVDNQSQTVTMTVQGEAPSLVFKRFDFSHEWTQVEGTGTVSTQR